MKRPTERTPEAPRDRELGVEDTINALLEARRFLVARIMVEVPRATTAEVRNRLHAGRPALLLSHAQVRTAMVDVWRHWREHRLKLIDDLVARELAMLDRLEEVLWPVVRAGGPKSTDAASRIVQVSERRARLLGLDAPARVTQRSVNVHIVRGDPVLPADDDQTPALDPGALQLPEGTPQDAASIIEAQIIDINETERERSRRRE